MRIITIANYKGGSGKTTTAINLAYNLAALHNKKVLLIDADPQGNASYLLARYNEYLKNLNDILIGMPITKGIYRTKYDNLDFVMSSTELEFFSGNCRRMRAVLKPVEEIYDYCIIDNRPALNNLAYACMVAADDIIIPVEMDQFSINGISFMNEQIAEIENIHNENVTYGCLITKYAKSKAVNGAIEKLVTEYDYPMYQTVIRRTSAVPGSTFARKPLLKYRHKDKATLDYIDFTEEYLSNVGDCYE